MSNVNKRVTDKCTAGQILNSGRSQGPQRKSHPAGQEFENVSAPLPPDDSTFQAGSTFLPVRSRRQVLFKPSPPSVSVTSIEHRPGLGATTFFFFLHHHRQNTSYPRNRPQKCLITSVFPHRVAAVPPVMSSVTSPTSTVRATTSSTHPRISTA